MFFYCWLSHLQNEILAEFLIRGPPQRPRSGPGPVRTSPDPKAKVRTRSGPPPKSPDPKVRGPSKPPKVRTRSGPVRVRTSPGPDLCDPWSSPLPIFGHIKFKKTKTGYDGKI